MIIYAFADNLLNFKLKSDQAVYHISYKILELNYAFFV